MDILSKLFALTMKFHAIIRCVCCPFFACKKLCEWLFCNRARRKIFLLTLAIYIATFCFILPFLLHNVPLTKYSQLWGTPRIILQEADNLNRQYADKAEAKLRSLPKEATKRLYEESSRNSNLELVIAVVTMSRVASSSSAPRYLTQVMVALDEILQRSGGLTETTMFMCNTNILPETHSEAISLSEYFPIVQLRKQKPSGATRYEYEKLDYLFCLEEAQKFKSKYVVVLQDDALPHPDFYSVLKYVLHHRVETQLHRGKLTSTKGNWVWLKLNFPNSLARYEGNPFFALEWISLSALMASMSTLLLSILCRCTRHLNRSGTKEKPTTTIVLPFLPVVLVSFPYFMLLLWVVGRPYINFPRSLSESFYTLGPGTSCCLPAVVFPQPQISGIVGYLQGLKLDSKFPLDFAMDDYRRQTGLRQYLIAPNLFSHIGFVSALHGRSNSRAAEGYLFALNYLKHRFPDVY